MCNLASVGQAGSDEMFQNVDGRRTDDVRRTTYDGRLSIVQAHQRAVELKSSMPPANRGRGGIKRLYRDDSTFCSKLAF